MSDKVRSLVMGASLGTGNRGVSALGNSLVALLRQTNPNGTVGMLISHATSDPFTVTIGGQRVEVPVVNCRMAPTAIGPNHLGWIIVAALVYRIFPFSGLRRVVLNSTPWVRSAVDAAFVGDVRGGDSFSDIYGMPRFVMGCLPVLSVIWVRGHLALLPQTYGPFKSRIARAFARYIIRHASAVVSRDQDSIALVKELCGNQTEVRFCQDVAFALESVRPESPAIEPPLPPERDGCLIGLNVNGLVYNGGYTRSNMFDLKLDYQAFLPEMVTALLANPKTRLLLVPHTFGPIGGIESDPAASRRLMEALPPELRSRVHLVTAEYDQNQIKGVIGMCDFFLGSRMHSCIAALSQAIPTIGIAYSKKFKGVFESVGAEDWVVDARTIDNAKALDMVRQLFAQRHEMRETLKAQIPKALEQLRDTFQFLVAAEKSKMDAKTP